jgi:hypothetical protein
MYYVEYSQVLNLPRRSIGYSDSQTSLQLPNTAVRLTSDLCFEFLEDTL